MGKLKVKMAELSKVHSQALMPTFDDSGGTDQTIEILTQEVTRGFKRCEQKLRRLETDKGAKGQDASIRKNVQVSWAVLLYVRLLCSFCRSLRSQSIGGDEKHLPSCCELLHPSLGEQA
jgi:hypothetical protein